MTDRTAGMEPRRPATAGSDDAPPTGSASNLRLANAAGNLAALQRLARRRRRDRRFPIVPLSRFQLANSAALVVSAILLAMLVLDPYVAVWRSGLPDPVEAVFSFLNRFGKSDWVLWGTGLFFLGNLARLALGEARRWRLRDWSRAAAAGYVFLAVAISGIVAVLLKYGLGRARPAHFEEVGPYSFQFITWEPSWASFPSGHATTAMALGVALGLLYPRLMVLFVCAGFWIALSRIVTGAHYPSDLIAGCLLGGVSAWIVARAFARARIVFCFDSGGRLARRARSS